MIYCDAAGIGSGFCVEHSDGSPVNLVTLYRAAKADRKLETAKTTEQRINRLMTPSLGQTTHLIGAVSELCRHADAFMLIVDSSSGPSMDKCMHISCSFHNFVL